MGGMSAAAMLARLGRRVLVLEQHFMPGGFTHTFHRGGYAWDVGVHAIGEVTENDPSGRLLHDLTRGRLGWASLGPVYDTFRFPGDVAVDFPDREAVFRETLVALEPAERRPIESYLARVRRDALAMRNYYRARAFPASIGTLAERLMARRSLAAIGLTLDAVLDDTTRSPRLRALLSAQWGYHGATPSRASWAMHALVTRHYLDGAWYPVGGARAIGQALLSTVAAADGWTRIASPVEGIMLDRGRAIGVCLESGEELRAPVIVSAVGVSATVRRLLPDPERSAAWTREIVALPPGPAHVCLYVGFKGDISSAGASATNQWFYESWDMERAGWDFDESGPVGESSVLYCSYPSLKDPSYDPGPELRHTAEVVTFVPWRAFEPWRATRWLRRGDAYEAFKARLADRLLQHFLRRMPGLRPFVDHVELSTPLTTDYFTRAIDGSMYGLAPTPARFRTKWLRPRSPIPGLFLAGSEVGAMGVMGAMTGGMLAATAVAPRAALPYLRRLEV
jgi:all-trans-retinol 13,14-reductase